MRWAVVAVAVATIVVAIALPWYAAEAIDGSAVMAGWGGWSSAAVDAHMLRFPVAVLIVLPAALILVSAVRQQFGVTALAATLITVLGILAYVARDAFAWHRDGGGAVYVEVQAAPQLVFVLGLAATFLGWFLYSRAILRPRPTA